ncbi:hypothetical protein [Muricoccus aerilatus]|uniref:hypothetical protein n=1 Tax=Muricoccus aerilatus TaxID=452982 RepID=UPI000693BDD6|nr:hypothetical protein [Roseomonas aerilata]
MCDMQRAILVLPLCLLTLSSCATGPNLNDRLAAYVGKSELELVSTIGVPASNYETGGQKFLKYEEQRTVAPPSGYAGPFYGGFGRGFYGRYGGFGGGFSTTYAPVQCDVTFALREGWVSGYTYRGQGCA